LGDLINVKHDFAFKGESFSDKPANDILLYPGNFKIGDGFNSGKNLIPFLLSGIFCYGLYFFAEHRPR
jgi:hypothetical protein